MNGDFKLQDIFNGMTRAEGEELMEMVMRMNNLTALLDREDINKRKLSQITGIKLRRIRRLMTLDEIYTLDIHEFILGKVNNFLRNRM